MKRTWSALAAALALGLGASSAYAQVCGVDYYGPCLPDAAPQKPLLKAAAVDPMQRTAFDEALFTGDDGLVKAVTFAEVTGAGVGGIKAASAAPGTGRAHDAPAAASKTSADFAINSVEAGGPVPDPESVLPGTRLDPVRTLPRTPEGSTLVRVIAPKSATGRLGWMSTQAQNAPRYAMNEETNNHASGMWEGAPKRRARTDLEAEAKAMNFIRPTP